MHCLGHLRCNPETLHNTHDYFLKLRAFSPTIEVVTRGPSLKDIVQLQVTPFEGKEERKNERQQGGNKLKQMA